MKIALLMPERDRTAFEYFLTYLAPAGLPQWKEHQILINPEQGTFDGLVALQSITSLDHDFHLVCPPQRTLLILREPPDILFLPGDFFSQFQAVVGSDTRVTQSRRIINEPAHHWFVEVPVASSNQLSTCEKHGEISAVVSGKLDTLGHRQRCHFMGLLKEHFGDRLDWFGRGVRELGQRKIDGLANYKYHIVLENGKWPGYWTEKLADAFVANCHPFYWGCPDVENYFPKKAFTRIDVTDPEGAISKIEAAIAADIWKKSLGSINEARELVWGRFHPFETYIRILSSLPSSSPRPVRIQPHSSFSYSFTNKLAHRAWRLMNRKKLTGK